MAGGLPLVSRPPQAKLQARGTQPPSSPQSNAGFIEPSEVGVRLEGDVRTLVVMAAVNMAGFDQETGGQALSPARAQLRRDLAKLDPALKDKLAAFYRSHRREGVEESVDAMRYAALSMLMTQPPAFSVFQRSDGPVPADLRPLLDFVPLVQEFYIKSGIKEILPKYLAAAETYAAAYRVPVGELIYETLDYFHAQTETVINMKPLVLTTPGTGVKKDAGVVTRTRSRHVFVVLDPLAALGTAIVRGDILNQKDELLVRRVGDDYIVVVGPSSTPTTSAIRQALIRFVIDPMVERKLRTSLAYKDQITKLVAGVPTASKEFGLSVYLVLRESLAQAAEARMKRIKASQAAGPYSEDEAAFDLAQAYLRGATLSFHFYDSLTGLEKVGLGIEDFFDQMLATAKFDREAVRAREFEPIVARVSAARPSGARTPAPTAASTSTLGEKILLSDNLIRQRRFGEARAVLEEILSAQPRNARALFGVAQVISQTPSKAELDPKADENDKIQAQHDRLEQAIKSYRAAIEGASRESESWLIQWCHLFIGRILDFQEFRADAIAEYEKAIALGDLANGAYKEALEGKQRPFGQK